MRLVLLTLAVLLLAPGARAEERLRDEVTGLLRSQDCAMPLERIEGVFTVMGHDLAELEAAVDGLLESGGAALSPDRRTLVLAPEACRPRIEIPREVEAVPWIEERLALARGCRRPLGVLEGEAREAGVAAEEFERAVRDLSAVGRYMTEGEALGLRADLCGPGREPDRPLARVEALRTEGLRATIGLLAMERGCRLPLSDRPALLRDLGATAVERMGLGRELSPDAAAALERRLAETLADPGPAYRIDRAAGEIVAIHCRP
ncbi:hypothetical protein Rumeso_00536 [Rubellimicrobium mesophilum DSM 19309]|uniref:Lipoprotein n=1 Tax=Rubellimicrobium mesophilum DSM 19309 TaxID=442562 RepID=A0A017HVM5_9RHOB|nr:hypothetical protein [Rubellimicrobium mesophilum]EYD77809.1 hypothetical protein Rumeso_00536 [Rubellimicrobium mesophilum DSM 19309]